ncbi:MAG: zinc-dependent alcohol dehydrogenase family protein [Deltaproteobacteria bacterium]|nr:zinc-dependent alcohol dehydrogenase family protein [Deltaproteobacteria bacterium]
MKALLLTNPGPIEIADRLELVTMDTPEPGPNQVRIKVSACGACHTDLHEVEGDLEAKKLPVIPGHQIVGTVDALGQGANEELLGKKVGLAWLYSSCGKCNYCEKGMENLCSQGRYTGWHVDGGYAEYTIAEADFVYPIPDGFGDLDAAPLLCGGVVGFRALELAGIGNIKKLGMYGFGNSAHVAIQIANHLKAECYVFTRSKEHQAHAISLGAKWSGTAEDDPGTTMDSSIVFAPAGRLVHLGLQALKKGGTLILAGIHMTPIPQMDYSMIYNEKCVKSVANATREDARKLLNFAASIPIRTDIEIFELAQGNEVMRRMKKADLRGGAVFKIA